MDKIFFYKQLCEEESVLLQEIKTLNETLIALQLLIKRYAVNNNSIEATNEPSPFGDVEENSNENTIQVHREVKRRNRTGSAIGFVLEAMELVGEGTAEDVSKVFSELHPEFPKDKAHKIAKNILSKLNQKGIISAEKVAGKNYFIYKFKKEADLPLF